MPALRDRKHTETYRLTHEHSHSLLPAISAFYSLFKAKGDNVHVKNISSPMVRHNPPSLTSVSTVPFSSPSLPCHQSLP